MRIMLLQSGDGGTWTWPVVLPENMSDEDACTKFLEIQDAAGMPLLMNGTRKA